MVSTMSALPNVLDVTSIAVNILPHIHSFDKMWYFTNHGEYHCKMVLSYINGLVDVCDRCGIALNSAEKTILECAAWLHDLGRIREEDDGDHALESVKIMRILHKKGHLNLGAINDEVEFVVSTHSSKGLSRLGEVEKIRPLSGVNDKVRLKLLCALFKLADECDIGRLRAPKPLYDILEDKMPESSKTHWITNRDVIKVDLSYEEGKIIVHIVEGGDEHIMDSLDETLKDERIREILTEYKFPIKDCYIYPHPKVDISED